MLRYGLKIICVVDQNSSDLSFIPRVMDTIGGSGTASRFLTNNVHQGLNTNSMRGKSKEIFLEGVDFSLPLKGF
ncbi:hypothetical protein QVD17_01915 [Tagetes erecta]|uniref:Uncharacterized protein n=1 Tax=Tagetes erecta TaxID=13708 RepID=A0AAD8L5P0_TARER|nr:hypothetical protein QVD17_01915 [Tagetes erecta]